MEQRNIENIYVTLNLINIFKVIRQLSVKWDIV